MATRPRRTNRSIHYQCQYSNSFRRFQTKYSFTTTQECNGFSVAKVQRRKETEKKKSSKSTSPHRSESAFLRVSSPSPVRENHNSSTSGTGRIVRPHFPVPTSNKFGGLEHMEITPQLAQYHPQVDRANCIVQIP